MKVQFKRSLLAGAALVAIAQTPVQAGDVGREPAEFAAAMAAVFPEYPAGSPQRAAISRDARVESQYRACRLSPTHDEGLLQLHGPRRAALHRATGVPMTRVDRGAAVPARNCVPMLPQLRFARDEWRAMPEACAAFERARTEAQAYRIFRGVYGRGWSLAYTLERRDE